MSARILCRRFFALAVFLAVVMASMPLSAKEASLRRWPNKMAAPVLKLTDLEGREWDAGNLRGKVVVLNFWASWCAPCIDEMTYLNELANNETGRDKLVVLGVNFKESESAVRGFASEHRFNYPILMDRTGERFQKWADGVLPTTVLIDRGGRPRWRVVGELERSDTGFRKVLDGMLQER